MKIALIIIAIVVVSWLGYMTAVFTVSPAARVAVEHEPGGDYRFDITPNFVVNSVYEITIIGPSGTVAERKQPVAGKQHINASGLSPGTQVTVRCRLQYDRIAPCITTQETTLKLP